MAKPSRTSTASTRCDERSSSMYSPASGPSILAASAPMVTRLACPAASLPSMTMSPRAVAAQTAPATAQ